MKVAVIVNDMSEINVDARLIREGGAALSRVDEQLVEMQNGCICCTLREDLLVEVGKLARERRFDYLLIESTGIAEPMPVAETFTFTDEQGRSLGDVARIDTMVTVVDARHFPCEMLAQDQLSDRALGLSADDTRSIAMLHLDQVEFANVIVLNKTDLVSAEDAGQVRALLQALNPRARIVTAVRGAVDPHAILNTGLYDQEQMETLPGWLSEPRHQRQPETDEYGITSFVYRARRPFHPARFGAFLEDGAMRSVLRSKGTLWLASRSEQSAVWSQAGTTCEMGPGGGWWVDLPKDQWPEDASVRAEIDRAWKEGVGDRRQEIVFIGLHLDRNALESGLNACLLTNEEMRLGDPAWARFPDPFPAWFNYAEEKMENTP